MTANFVKANSMRKFFITIVGLIFSAPTCDAAETVVGVALTKEVFLLHEPIEVSITLRNRATYGLILNLHYPFLTSPRGTGGLTFRLENTGLRKSALSAIPDAKRFGNPIQHVAVGQCWTKRVYLQRFVQQPSPGKHRVPFQLVLPFSYSVDGREKHGQLLSEGILSFSVVRKDEELSPIFEAFLKMTSDRRRPEGLEALSVIDHPAVVPYLVRLARGWLTEEALEVLARFPRDKQAGKAVLDALTSDEPAETAAALRVLTKWKYPLGAGRIQELVRRNNRAIDRALTLYVDADDREDLRKLLRRR